MTSTLPPDPYKLLGVSKDAKLAEIRSAHRKLVLKCHPDKVQDAALKAIKVDEFQKVQQAYELLSDENRRIQYDEQVKLFELRKEMGRGNPTPRSNPFEYEVKTAEPRPDSFSRPQPSPKYTYPTTAPPPRSHEPAYEESRHMPKKPTSFEDRERKRSSREDELRREAHLRKVHEDEERARQQREKEARRSGHSEKKKSRDKERKRGSEEKASRTRGAYVDEDSSDEYGRTPPRTSDKKSSRHKASMEEEIRIRNEEAARVEEAARKAARAHEQRVPVIKEAPLDPKWSEHMEYAGAYMQAARRKVAVDEAPHVPPPPHPGMRRAETFAAPASGPYTVRYATAPPGQYSDDEAPRRSSARKESRRTSDTPPTRKRSKERERKGSPSHPRDPYIVEPASPTMPSSRKPSLQTHSSAPPQVFAREKPSRSKTEYPATRKDPMPGIPRAHTFSESRSRERGSKLKQEMPSDSESDTPVYQPRVSHSPPPTTRRAPETTRYVVQDGRANPVISNTSRHRSDLRDLNDQYPRDRSESPRGGTARYSSDRPAVTRNPSSSEHLRTTSRSQPAYYVPSTDAPEPIILSARPKMSSREQASHRGASYAPPPGAVPFNKVQYSKSYTPEQVIYATHPAAGLYDSRRGGRDHDEYYTAHVRGGRGDPVYA